MATGRLKKYSLVITSVAILEFPLVWVAFSLGATPLYAYYIYVFVKTAALIARMFLMEEMIHLKATMYVTHVFLPIILTTLIALVVPLLLNLVMEPSLIRLVVVSVVSVLSVGLSALYLGMTVSERQVILNSVRTVIGKFVKKS
jgi:hypothetical protein